MGSFSKSLFQKTVINHYRLRLCNFSKLGSFGKIYICVNFRLAPITTLRSGAQHAVTLHDSPEPRPLHRVPFPFPTRPQPTEVDRNPAQVAGLGRPSQVAQSDERREKKVIARRSRRPPKSVNFAIRILRSPFQPPRNPKPKDRTNAVQWSSVLSPRLRISAVQLCNCYPICSLKIQMSKIIALLAVHPLVPHAGPTSRPYLLPPTWQGVGMQKIADLSRFISNPGRIGNRGRVLRPPGRKIERQTPLPMNSKCARNRPPPEHVVSNPPPHSGATSRIPTAFS